MGPVIVGLIRAGIPAAKIIAKYGKRAYTAAKKTYNSTKKTTNKTDKISGYNKNNLSATITKKQKEFLTNFKKEAKGYDVKYNIKGDKLTIKNSQKEIKKFDNFFSPSKPTESFGEKVPSGLTSGSVIKKLK